MSLIPKKYEEAVDEARALAKESLLVRKEMADTLRRIENLLERILEASQNPTFGIRLMLNDPLFFQKTPLRPRELPQRAQAPLKNPHFLLSYP